MEEAENIEFTEQEYLDFKRKYNMLYFPEYKDDYGAYTPFTNEKQAIVLNKNGQVLIGGKLFTEKRITNYEELRQTGRSYYETEKSKNTLLKSKISNSIINWNTVKTSEHIEEFSSGWRKVGKGKKIKLNFGIRNMIVRDRGVCFHSEVSFRKKGFAGKWYNYKSYTNLTVKLYKENIPEDVSKDINKIINYPIYNYEANPFIIQYSHNGTSSHDSYTTVPSDFYLYQNGKSNIIKGYKIVATLQYRGMSNEIVYLYNYNRSYSKLVQNKNFWRTIGPVVNPVLKLIFIAIARQIGEDLGEGLVGGITN